MKLFYYWQTFVRARFKGVCLLTKTVFQLSWKKSLRCAIFGLVVWTTFLERHLKKFWKFWISEFPPTFHGKVRFFLKKSENNIFTKKIFFFFDEVLKGYQEVPQVKNFFFHLPIGWECMKRLTHVNLASKKFFYLISLYGPVSGPKTPWMCQKSFFSYFPPY